MRIGLGHSQDSVTELMSEDDNQTKLVISEIYEKAKQAFPNYDYGGVCVLSIYDEFKVYGKEIFNSYTKNIKRDGEKLFIVCMGVKFALFSKNRLKTFLTVRTRRSFLDETEYQLLKKEVIDRLEFDFKNRTKLGE